MRAPVTQETTHALLRIVAGLMLWQHGAQKLFGMFGSTAVESWFAWPRGVAGIIEFFLPILIILGIRTRWVAFILTGHFAVVYWWRHFFAGGVEFVPIVNGGELAILYCAIFLFLWTTGGGKWNLDHMIPGPGRED
ncbi:DoxX family protein [Candidatus Palauibacter sp.]|uniref:DoxX family protein n=1 Tax=Candidatus Palauibacter sp. TaxID=3101350 RepID=UPI003AF2C196